MINRYTYATGQSPSVFRARRIIGPALSSWGGDHILGIRPSGSLAKGTAVRGGTDIDFFVSLKSTVPVDLRHIYDTLLDAFLRAGLPAYRKNVAVGLDIDGVKIDVTPGRRQHGFGGDHSLYSNKSGTWLKTNIGKQIRHVSESRRVPEIRLMKIWRNRLNLEWPSYYLELFVISALYGRRAGALESNIRHIFILMDGELATKRIIDPANTNNVVSNSLTVSEKFSLADAANFALRSRWEMEFA